MEYSKNTKIFPSKYQFYQILWENEPILTTQLVYLCRDKLNLTKSTTYTVIRQLVLRDIIKKEGALCRLLVSKIDIQYNEITQLFSECFEDYSEFIQIVKLIQK